MKIKIKIADVAGVLTFFQRGGGLKQRWAKRKKRIFLTEAQMANGMSNILASRSMSGGQQPEAEAL
jgi:hypothetical protein